MHYITVVQLDPYLYKLRKNNNPSPKNKRCLFLKTESFKSLIYFGFTESHWQIVEMKIWLKKAADLIIKNQEIMSCHFSLIVAPENSYFLSPRSDRFPWAHSFASPKNSTAYVDINCLRKQTPHQRQKTTQTISGKQLLTGL